MSHDYHMKQTTRLKIILKLESVGGSLIVFGNTTRPSENEDTFILKPTVKVE